MNDKVYKVRDLKKIEEITRMVVNDVIGQISESASKNEFKPKIGDGVVSKNKSENKKAYSETKKRTSKYDGGPKEVKGEPKVEKNDGNKTMLSINPENVTPEYKERVKAQAEGYTSVLEKNNKIEKDPSLEFNKRSYDAITKEAEKMDDNLEIEKRAGLRGHNMPKDYYKREKVYENVKVVNFKTKFLSEEHMYNKIPDILKNEGQKIKMVDNTGNTYLLEWTNNKPEIISNTNPIKLKESIDRMKGLMNYNPKDQRKTNRKQF